MPLQKHVNNSVVPCEDNFIVDSTGYSDAPFFEDVSGISTVSIDLQFDNISIEKVVENRRSGFSKWPAFNSKATPKPKSGIVRYFNDPLQTSNLFRKYTRQDPTCILCCSPDHTIARCPENRCFECFGKGHTMSHCENRDAKKHKSNMLSAIYHSCESLSPFKKEVYANDIEIINPIESQNPENFLESIRCLYCGELGHVNCQMVKIHDVKHLANFPKYCYWCSKIGHTASKCPQIPINKVMGNPPSISDFLIQRPPPRPNGYKFKASGQHKFFTDGEDSSSDTIPAEARRYSEPAHTERQRPSKKEKTRKKKMERREERRTRDNYQAEQHRSKKWDSDEEVVRKNRPHRRFQNKREGKHGGWDRASSKHGFESYSNDYSAVNYSANNHSNSVSNRSGNRSNRKWSEPHSNQHGFEAPPQGKRTWRRHDERADVTPRRVHKRLR
eukprot:Platyproteum_vivax@DN5785_c0_g1_i1.p1